MAQEWGGNMPISPLTQGELNVSSGPGVLLNTISNALQTYYPLWLQGKAQDYEMSKERQKQNFEMNKLYVEKFTQTPKEASETTKLNIENKNAPEKFTAEQGKTAAETSMDEAHKNLYIQQAKNEKAGIGTSGKPAGKSFQSKWHLLEWYHGQNPNADLGKLQADIEPDDSVYKGGIRVRAIKTDANAEEKSLQDIEREAGTQAKAELETQRKTRFETHKPVEPYSTVYNRNVKRIKQDKESPTQKQYEHVKTWLDGQGADSSDKSVFKVLEAHPDFDPQ